MDILGTIDLSGFLNIRVRGEGLSYQAAQLFFVVGVPFDSFNNQAMGRTSCLLR